MGHGHYILDGKTPVEVKDLTEWAQWFGRGNDNRRVAQTIFERKVNVSTVFLGLDHNFGDGPPILFETMIFGGPFSDFQDRYETWEEAEKGHLNAVKMIFEDALKREDFEFVAEIKKKFPNIEE